MASASRHVPDNFYNSTGDEQWGPLYLYKGLPVLSRSTPPGSEPVALNIGRNPSLCEELYNQYDDEYENEQLDNAAAANETASGPGWGVEPSVIIPRSAYPSSERRGTRGSGRSRR
ncbi:hypothetical protein BCON_0046g00160 [Botryotinia convoluta]|uniref:Uncharacterized protein n=1 Tax=Botryotinia convoluta TaxID=54673 RepID=A0A4Z1II94_9HELO|nr:hypothetical protein BCON_0046g00160 [Botryotinia convoluta]